ncbi:junction-mediating and -regulatory protein isoform X2 [Pseudoliparis swirei]|uniref:junction-mediating and -regulatory protein isoform X2 n=1 Tax=Pseudoliparis swirei TaxID=2059687 RepID=UPI0024BDFB09|nr:junction-mediating and -regulatory protein isoform X2 [Pseudoliparis swirei]
MSFTMEDNLEAEWVSVRPRVFDEKERHKFVFIVAWNVVEGKFAITCHNRTVQRRTTFLLDPLPPPPGAPAVEKHAKSRKDEVRPHSVPKGKPTTNTIVGDKHALKPGGSKSSECVSPASGSWDVVTPKVMDVELLDHVDVPLSPDDGDPEDGDGSGLADFSWAGLFSFQDLRAAHHQLCAVNSDLEPCLPSFPEEQSGVWSLLFGGVVAAVSQGETEALCYQLQVYLGHALDTCGWKILSEVLFSGSEDTDEYYESLSELRRNGYEEAVGRAKRSMLEVLEKHKATDSMVELLQVYPEEDETYGELLEATTQLYHYLLQPFRDMRELAMLRRQQIKISLETERLGPRRVEGLRKEDEEWQKKAHAAVLSIQDLTVKFFETTTRAQKALHERMRADQKKFGNSAWAAAAAERMEQLQYAASKETLQLMRAKEVCLEQRKHGLKEEMQSLRGGEDAMLRLDRLEELYYELQLQLYGVQAELLRCEELLLTAQLQSLRRQTTERQDEVVYYDAFESPDAMKGEEGPATPTPPLRDEDIVVLQQRTRQLEARRGRITAKRVYLKNKKEICIVNHNQKIKQRQGSRVSLQTLQQGEDAEEDGEASSDARVSRERQRTLDRLRSLKQRYPGQVTLKSSRLRLSQPLGRRRAGQQRGSHSAGVQTDLPRLSAAPPPDAHVSLPTVELHDLDSSPAFLSLPPPPPPPLPPPPSEDQQEENNPSPLRRHEAESSSLPLAPFSPRFFDSSQLQTARKKLKKTSSLDSSQWRRASSPMDEVLASLKRGCFHLRKAELRVLAPDPDDEDDNILTQIRQGVRLKKVRTRPEQQRHARSFTHSADALTRSIHEALRRIKEASPDSESEDEGLPCTDWEN